MTRIVATSDLHGKLPKIPECDLLIIAGDICPDGPPLIQAKWINIHFREWLKVVPAKEIAAIAGNHDLIFETAENLVPKGLRWHYLQDSLIELFGLKIYGTPWQLPFWGAFNLEEESLTKRYSNIPENVDIIVSHGPPFGIGDEVPQIIGPEKKLSIQHAGSISLRNRAFAIHPKLVIYGHIHCAFGLNNVDDILFANVSLLDDDLEMVNQPVAFEIG
jgi:Icc-related predicted phosphoesterase